jgi:hypothetical protein
LLVCAVIVLAVGQAQASFRLFDNFEDELVGPIDGQDNWDSSGGDNRVIVDPTDPGNQVLYVPSASSVLHKALGANDLVVADGTSRMVFMRMRLGDKQTFSVGLSFATVPREYSDFATETGMANSTENLDLRAWDDVEGNYTFLSRLDPGIWYNVWVLTDAGANQYQIWLNAGPGAGATQVDRLASPDGVENFEFRSGKTRDLLTFYIKTSGGGSGVNFGPVYFDDIYVGLTDSVDLTNPTVFGTASQISELVTSGDKTTLSWEALDWATTYDVVRGDLDTLRDSGGEFALAVTACLDSGAALPLAQDSQSPYEGSAYFYLVRGVNELDGVGTYDSGGSEQAYSRDPGIDSSSAACP